MKKNCYKCAAITEKFHYIRDEYFCDRCVNPNKYIRFNTHFFDFFTKKSRCKLEKTQSIILSDNTKRITRQKSHSFSTFPKY